MMLTSSPVSIRFQRRLQEHFRDSQLEVGPWEESQEDDARVKLPLEDGRKFCFLSTKLG